MSSGLHNSAKLVRYSPTGSKSSKFGSRSSKLITPRNSEFSRNYSGVLSSRGPGFAVFKKLIMSMRWRRFSRLTKS